MPRRVSRGFDTYRNYDWLYQKLVVEGKYPSEVAKEAGCGVDTIRFWAKEFDISIKKYKATPEHCEAISKSRKGQPSGNKGKKYPKEKYPDYGMRNKTVSKKTRKKQSDKRRGKIFPKEKYPNFGMRGKTFLKEEYPNYGNRGKKYPKEEYPNYGMRNKICSEEKKRKIGDANRGKKKPPLSKEHKRKLSEAKRGKKRVPFSEEHCRNISKGLLKRYKNSPMSEETKRKIGDGNRDKSLTEITKRKMRKRMLKDWADPEFQKIMALARAVKPTNPERIFNKMTPDVVRYVGDGQFFITTNKRTHNPDFVIEGQYKVIEIFGDFWHKGEDLNKLIKEYAEVGFDCIIFWQHEVLNEARQVLNEVLEFIES